MVYMYSEVLCNEGGMYNVWIHMHVLLVSPCTATVLYVHLRMYVEATVRGADAALLLYTSRYVVVFLVQEAFPGHSVVRFHA